MNFCGELLYLKALVPEAFGHLGLYWGFGKRRGLYWEAFLLGDFVRGVPCSLLITILTEGEAIPFTVRLGLKAPSIRSI